MDYLYGNFTDKQIYESAQLMHNDIHKLLLFKDKNVKDAIFNSEQDFLIYFENLLYRFGGLNDLLGQPVLMVNLMSTLQAAYSCVQRDDYSYKLFRKLILDSHSYIKEIFEGGDTNAKPIDC